MGIFIAKGTITVEVIVGGFSTEYDFVQQHRVNI